MTKPWLYVWPHPGWTSIACLLAMVCRPVGVPAADLSWRLYYSEIGVDAGVFELFVAADGLAHAGLVSYSVQLIGGIDTLDHRSPQGLGQSALGPGAIAFGGFGRSVDGQSWLTATQDTMTGLGMLVYDFGILPGDIAVTAAPPPMTVFSSEQPVYAAPLNIARGTWSGAPPQFTGPVTANVFRTTRDGSTMSGSSETLTSEFLPGDANRDGAVDGSDFSLWNAHKFVIGTDWATGDFDGNGVTDGTDFNFWNANKFTSSMNVGAVPEPTPWLLCLLSILTADSARWESVRLLRARSFVAAKRQTSVDRPPTMRHGGVRLPLGA